MRLLVMSTARTSSVSASIPMWTLRYWRWWLAPCLWACQSPSTAKVIPVRSTSKYSGADDAGYGTPSDICRRQGDAQSGTRQSSPDGQTALYEPSRLPAGQPEQHLDREAELEGRRRKPLRMTRLAARDREPSGSHAASGTGYRWSSSSLGKKRTGLLMEPS